MTEREFQSRIIQVAKLHGWLCYHTHDSRRSEPGFPDLVLVKGERVLFRELKTDKGRLTKAQQQWGDALTAAGADYAVWRPKETDRNLSDTHKYKGGTMQNILNNPVADLYHNPEYLTEIKKQLVSELHRRPQDVKLMLDLEDRLTHLETALKPLGEKAPLEAVAVGKELLTAGLASQHYVMPPGGVTVELGHPELQTLTLFEDEAYLTSFVNKTPLTLVWQKADSGYFFLPALYDNEIIAFLLLLSASVARDFWTLEERTRTRAYQQRSHTFRTRKGKGKDRKLQKAKGWTWIPRFRYDIEQYQSTSTIQHAVRVTLSPHLVSGHIRRLTKGKASKEAIETAADFGIKVGGAVTFVKPYKRGEIEQLRTYRSRSALQLLFGNPNACANP